MPKHDEDSGGISKKTLTDSWGQCALIQCNGQKKAQVFNKKQTFCL
jgi:hypothetical protein